MTRDELAALLVDIIGLRLQPIALDTIMAAVDKHVEHAVEIAKREWEPVK